MSNYEASTSTQYKRTVNLTDDAPQVTSAGGVTVQPRRLDYSWFDEELPQVVEVGGPRIRKDGGRGGWVEIAVVLVKAPSDYYAAAPQWIRDLVTTDPR